MPSWLQIVSWMTAEKVTAFSTFALVIVGVLTAWVLFFQFQLARKEFLAAHRPKLRIRNIDIHPPSACYIMPNGVRAAASPTLPLFAPNNFVNGQLYISNVGDSRAIITEAGCWVKWMQGTLPMSRPYEGKDGNILGRRTLEAGEPYTITFSSDTLMGNEGEFVRQCSNDWYIYVMGWVEYVDKLNTRRRTAFCRAYRMPEGRFFAVTDPDYEHEE